MKRTIYFILFLFLLTVFSCSGGGSTGGDDVTSNYFNPNTAPDKILFDVTTSNIPLPNDAALSNDGKLVFTSNTTPVEFYPVTKSYDNISLKGLSANTPIYIPLNTNNQLDINSVYSNLFLVPININVVKSGTTIPIVAGPENLSIKQGNDCIKVVPLTPLMPNTQYALIIKQGVKFEDGQLLGRDASYELLFDTYSPILEKLNLNKDDVLAMFTFTTADKTVNLLGFATAKFQLENGMDVNLPNTDVLPYDNITLEMKTILGGVTLLPVNKLPDNFTTCGLFKCDKTQFISFDITTLTKIPLPDIAKVPVEIIPAIDNSTNKVVIFQHGLGGSKDNVYNSQFAYLTQKLIANGFTVVSMDLPYHGDRVDYDNLTYDCNKDGVVTSGECFLTANLVQDRINIYQSVFDLSMLLKGLKNGTFDLNGDGINDNVTNVYFVGLSMGAITGSIFAALNINNLDKIVLNVGGANFAVLLDGTAIPDLNEALKELGFEKDTPQYIGFLGLLDLVLDPSDPMYFVNETMKDKVLIQNAYNDIIVPNDSNAILAKRFGYESPVFIDCNETFDNSSAGWYMFGNPEWVTHAFLISYFTNSYPDEVQQFYDEDYIKKCQEIAQDQIFKFFGGGN